MAGTVYFLSAILFFSFTTGLTYRLTWLPNASECDKFGICSQTCTLTYNGSFKCSCMEGFQLGGDLSSCNSIDPFWKLLYTTKSDIGVILKGSGGRERNVVLTRDEGRPIGVTFDARSNVVYWTDGTPYSQAIYRKNLSSVIAENVETVVDTGLLLPEGIAFDWITGNIYFADSNRSHIAVCKNDTGVCAVVLQEGVDKPRDIALDPNQRIMFWTDWGMTPCIFRAGMDGALTQAIITTNLQWPNGIALDQGSSRIYWVDAGLDRIETSRLDGSDRHIVISTGHPFGIDVFGERIFWSDWSSYEIKSADKYNGSNPIVHQYDPQTLMSGLALFHVANQPIFRSNPCATANCSHICTLTPTSTFKCFCPAGMVLANDKKTCIESEHLPKLVIAFKATIKTMRFNTIGKEIFDTITFSQLKSISAIVYNPINNTLIISDTTTKKIYEYSINRKRLGVLIDQHLDFVKGMDIDVVGENLYWVDSGKQTVEAMSFRTSARTIIMNLVENPYDILVVPEMGCLYLARMGKRGGKIYKMFLNGRSNSVFQRVGDKEPIALAYDKEFNNILWADKMYRSIESISSDGKSNSRIAVQQQGPPSDVVKYGNQVFWIDMFSQVLKIINVGSYNSSIIRIGNFEGNSSSSSNKSTNFFAKMTIINRDLSSLDVLRNKHDCSLKNPNRKTCSHMCLLTGDEFAGVCRCSDGLILGEDGMTCIKPSTCNQDQFTCNDGNCISKTFVCDGTGDCTNHDDEVNCNETTCMEGTVKCPANGVCIPNDWVCDGTPQCTNQEDELNCNQTACSEGSFKCPTSGICIPNNFVCDGAVDCPGDNFDERNCNFTCPQGFFKCAISNHCIVKEWICDGTRDYDDGSDEMENCTGNNTCSPDQFSCNNGKCIDVSFRCDGVTNCVDNDDEKDCDVYNQIQKQSKFVNESAVGPKKHDITRDKVDQNGGPTVTIVLGFIVIIILVAGVIALVLDRMKVPI